MFRNRDRRYSQSRSLPILQRYPDFWDFSYNGNLDNLKCGMIFDPILDPILTDDSFRCQHPVHISNFTFEQIPYIDTLTQCGCVHGNINSKMMK